MPCIAIYSEVPAVQSADDLLDWILEGFGEYLGHRSYLLLDRDNISALMIAAERFREKHARSEERLETDSILKEKKL